MRTLVLLPYIFCMVIVAEIQNALKHPSRAIGLVLLIAMSYGVGLLMLGLYPGWSMLQKFLCGCVIAYFSIWVVRKLGYYDRTDIDQSMRDEVKHLLFANREAGKKAESLDEQLLSLCHSPPSKQNTRPLKSSVLGLRDASTMLPKWDSNALPSGKPIPRDMALAGDSNE
jgi:hypothetical protein